MICLSYRTLLFILLSTKSFYFAAALPHQASETLCLYSVCEEHACSWHIAKQCPYLSHVNFGICSVRQAPESDTAWHCQGVIFYFCLL